MADHIVSINYPAPVNWARWFRNGKAVTAQGHRWINLILANVAQYRKKLVFSHTQDFASIGTAESSTRTRWRFSFRSGNAAHKLEFAMLLGLEDHASAADPYCYWDLTEVGVGTTSGPKFRYGQFSASPDDTPDEFMWTSQTVDILPETHYDVELNTNDYSRPVACLVFERGALTGLDDTDTGAVNPTVPALGMPILDDEAQAQLDAGTRLWNHSGSQLFALSGENLSSTAEFSTTSTSFRNIYDNSTISSAITVGHTVQATYHNADSEATVPVEFFVYAEHTSAFATTGEVKLTDGTTSLTITGITTEGWYSITGAIPAALAKWDVRIKMSGASGTATKLWAASLCEWV